METEASSVHSYQAKCAFPKLCTHAAVARKSRHQFQCMKKDLDDQSPSIWRFLSWVAYSRSWTAPSQITDYERLRCPLIWCRTLVGDRNMLLEHVFTCAHLSDGRYWCYDCQKEESFTPFQCKHCQVPAFRKDRLSTKAKRFFRRLGTRKSHKDSQRFEESAFCKRISHVFGNQCLQCSPKCHDITATSMEMDGHQVSCELGGNYISTFVELNGCDILPAELSGQSTPDSELPDSSLGSEVLLDQPKNQVAIVATYNANMGSVQTRALSIPPFEIWEPPTRSCLSKSSVPQPQSLVSPHTTEMLTGTYNDTICESPTNTDFSGSTLFSKSTVCDISPPSTRNSTIQSISQSSSSWATPLEHRSDLPDMRGSFNDLRDDRERDYVSIREPANQIPLGAFSLTEKSVAIHASSSTWLTKGHLLNDFWRVLALHVHESLERLKMLSNDALIAALQSMSASKIAFQGFSAWQRTLKGHPLTSIIDMYALVHVAYACAIVVYDGLVENLVMALFLNSLSIAAETLPDEEKSSYFNIAYSIWCPGMESAPLTLFASAMQSTFSMKVPSTQPRDKRGAPLEPYLKRDNELFVVLAHFLDIFDGTTLCSELTSLLENQSNGFGDASFIQAITENVTIPLIEARFQPGPSLEGFIMAVTTIENLVHHGQITTVRMVEAGLKWAGRSIAKSMELYGIFSDRVKHFCSVASHRLLEDSALQNESYIEGINTMSTHLSLIISNANKSITDEDHLHRAITRPGQSSRHVGQNSIPPDTMMDVFAQGSGLSESNVTQVGLCRRPAMKRKMSQDPSSGSPFETRLSPSSSTSSTTLPAKPDSDYTRCLECGFQPSGERKWHKRTVNRHYKTCHDPNPKVYACNHKGCKSVHSRADNLTAHVRRKHQGARWQGNA